MSALPNSSPLEKLNLAALFSSAVVGLWFAILNFIG